MATTATNGHIADDWQDVDADAFSVVSLPTSDGESDSLPDSPTHSPLSHSVVQLPIRPKQPVANERTPNYEETDNDVERYGVDTRDVIDPEEAVEDQLNGILDVDMDPAFLQQVTTSMIKLVVEVVGVINFRGKFYAFDGVEEIKSECETLKSHLRSLEPILLGYSKHWKPQGATSKIPIDPGLYEWLASLRVELLGLQASLQTQMGHDASPSNQAWNHSNVKHYRDILEDFSGQIEAFMPIIKSDFDEFHTSRLSYLTISDNQPPTSPPNNDGPRIGRVPPGSNLFQLRHSLYALKDQISACIAELEETVGCGPANDETDLDVIGNIMGSYRNIKISLEMMLSNHASDWIDYSVAGGLTYSEFSRLNQDTIRSLSLQLKEMVDELFLERSRVKSVRYVNDPDDLLEAEKLAIKQSEINGLSTMEEVLSSIFQLRKPSPAPAK